MKELTDREIQWLEAFAKKHEFFASFLLHYKLKQHLSNNQYYWLHLYINLLTMSIIEASWNEFTMDWITKPPYGQIIGLFTVPSSDIYKNDITSLLTPRTEISICVNITIDNYVEDYVYITSREGYYLSSDAPQIIWTYLVDVPESPAIPSYSVFIIIGIIGTIGIFLTKKIKRKEVLTLKL